MRKCIRMAEGACKDQLSFPAMQVTSSHVPSWFDLSCVVRCVHSIGLQVNTSRVQNQCSPTSAQCSAAEPQCRAAELGWRFGDSSSSLDESSHRWVPARTPTVHLCPTVGRPWVARQAPRHDDRPHDKDKSQDKRAFSESRC